MCTENVKTIKLLTTNYHLGTVCGRYLWNACVHSVLVWAFAWCSCSLMTEHSYKTSALPDVDPTKHRSKLEVASQLRWAFIPLQTVCELCKDCSQTGKSLQLFRATELARHTVKVSIHSSVSRGTLYRSQTLLVGAASPNLVF